MTEKEKYLIWSNEHNAWWGQNGSGYTGSTDTAGRYSLEKAIEVCNGANYDWNTDQAKKIPNELPILEKAALKLQYKERV